MRHLLMFLGFATALGCSTAFSSDKGVGKDLRLRWVSDDGTVLASRTLTINDLDAMEQVTIETSTPWTDGVHTFEGPLLADLAAMEDIEVTGADVAALNDYSADLPAEDFDTFRPILSTRFDGETMEIREKGPFWIMYPLEDNEELHSHLFNARMVWQVRSIDFLAD